MTPPTSIVCKEWSKYGKHRLYVKYGEEKLGWCDLTTGDRMVTTENRDLIEPFHQAVDQWFDNRHASATPQPPVPVIVPPPAEAVWQDLSENRAGQAAREVAAQEWEALKNKSKLLAYGGRLVGAKTDERSWRVGADGEESVGARLQKLTTKGWHILHAVPVGNKGSDIDHILIGHGGVYTLNTKNHPGGNIWVSAKTVMVNGQRTEYLRNSRFEAQRAAKLLTKHLGWTPPVHCGLVLLTGTRIPNVTIKSKPEDVFIWDRIDIPKVFTKAPVRLSEEGIAEVYEVARRSTTWVF